MSDEIKPMPVTPPSAETIRTLETLDELASGRAPTRGSPPLFTYLTEHVEAGVVDFTLRAFVDSDGNVTFNIRPYRPHFRPDDRIEVYHLQPKKSEVFTGAAPALKILKRTQ